MTHITISHSQYAVIWFGAAMSIAEILTGTYLAPLGFHDAACAIVLGHIIGGLLLWGAGIIGGKLKCSSMNSTAFSFGHKGAVVFALFNIIQLVGWTSIMMYDAAIALQELYPLTHLLWVIVLSLLILLWIRIGLNNIGYIQGIVASLLLGLSMYMGFSLYESLNIGTAVNDNSMTFMAGLELSVAMPLSWLPLISDYTQHSKRPVTDATISTGVYTLTGIAMYMLGLCAALSYNDSSIIPILLHTGMGLTGLVIIIFSTVTTTFMDAISAGSSYATIQQRPSSTVAAVITTITGGVLATLFPMDDITDFLYLIGSLFAPMIAILLTDFYRRYKPDTRREHVLRGIIWLISVFLYHWMLRMESPVGATLPAIVTASLLTYILTTVTASSRRN